MKLAYEKNIDEVYSINFKIPNTCASGYFFINAAYCFNFNINGDEFGIEYQNGNSFCFGDFNSPSNKMEYYSLDNTNDIELKNDKLEVLREMAGSGCVDYIEGDVTCYTEAEIIKIKAMFEGMAKEANDYIESLEHTLEIAKDNDDSNHTYIWVKTQSGVYSIKYATPEEAYAYLEQGGEDIMGAHICDVDYAYSLWSAELSNFDITAGVKTYD